MAGPVLAVVDYGAGNLRSVCRALEAAGARPLRVERPEAAADADGIVLPGVGAFGPAIVRLQRSGFAAWITERARAGVPLLGVCLGMQLLFEVGEEGRSASGLGLLPGSVRRLAGGLKVPHMGWNQLAITRPIPALAGAAGRFFYFVHSYVAQADPADVVAVTTYGETFPAAVQRGRILGTQFHPEKSGSEGVRLLHGIVRWFAAPERVTVR